MALDVNEAYRRYGPMVLRRCRALLHDEALAEDAMQDAFVRLWARRDDLEATGLSSLLFQIATQVSLNRLRSARRRPEHPGDALLSQLSSQGDLEGAGSARDLLARLFGAEPVSSRVIAVLHLHDGMTLDEVAEATGLSVSGVRKRLRAMRRKLEQLAPREEAA